MGALKKKKVIEREKADMAKQMDTQESLETDKQDDPESNSSSKKVVAVRAKKLREIVKERAKERTTKKMKRQLAAVQQRKQNKTTQEELFASLAQYQLDPNKLKQLDSTIHMQDKEKIVHSVEDETLEFPSKLKACSSKIKLTKTIHQKERVQENYYPTDDESSSEDEAKSELVKPEEVEEEPVEVEVLNSEEIVEAEKEMTEETRDLDEDPVPRKRKKKSKLVVTKNTSDDEDDAPVAKKSVPIPETVVVLDADVEKPSEAPQKEPVLKPRTRKHVFVQRSKEIEDKRSDLPIYAEEVPILEAIDENLVTVISGETGSGKTTQIPQFLYEAGYASDGQIIGITEPRRVAAISMAQRVGEELGLKDEVSYQIRYEGTRSEKTKILFMTDGVLMKEMEKDLMLNKYSAILIDEAHERSMYSDILIGMLSRIAPLRAKTAKPLKLIIMSATLRLQDFLQPRLFPVTLPKTIKVDSRQFPVTVHFEKKTPVDYTAAAFKKTCKIHEKLPDGAILIFVSGQQEVKHLVKILSTRYPVIYDEKDGEKMVKGSKKWKNKQFEKIKEMKLEDFKEPKKEEESTEIDGEDLLESGVGGDVWDDYDQDEGMQESESDLGPPPPNSRPLYCLPLYSLLSTEKQRRVFEKPPEGSRLCVVATNVAETSLTIPGVRYVVDAGFEKRRLYDPITGVSRFVVTHISQASADQRAGRAGRICAGHAYRLYSSAVFQDFQQFSRPEILDKPADQLVLHLKSMNIVKVVNFPFPSSPDEDVLQAAENRLLRLGALSNTTRNNKTEARITSLGKTLAVFPLSPAYAKVIAMANQHGLMPYAISLISALSVREPLVPVHSLRGSNEEETKAMMTDVLKLRRGWCGKGPARRLGDLLVLMKAVSCSEEANMNPHACIKLGLRPKAMLEIRRLRTQLTNIINTSFKDSDNVELNLKLNSPTDAQAQMLRQMMISGLADNIARRVDKSATDEEIPKGAYQTTKLQEYVFIDPTSIIYTEEPDYVIYQEIVQIGDKKCMQTLMTVDYEWLPRLTESHCNFGTMDQNEEPRYNQSTDTIVRKVSVTFGPLEWDLGHVDRPIPNDIMLYRYFAQFLLNGEVFPLLAEYTPKMLAPATTMVKSWAKLQHRTEAVLNALVDKEIHSREALKELWLKKENFLIEQYLLWLPESLHASVTMMWPPLEEKTDKMGRNKHYM